MTRRARRYRNLTWIFIGGASATAALTGIVWASGWPTLLAITQAAMLLTAVGAITCTIMMRRGPRTAQQVDFSVGIGGYRLTDLADRHHEP